MDTVQNAKYFAYNNVNASLSLKIYKKVLAEVDDLNNDFHTLRTVMHPDKDEHINLFYFVMMPNDGAMAHMPLVGRMIIPPTYPNDPPVIHLYTETYRYNVDVYRGYIKSPQNMHSSMCFDVLNSKQNGGIWEPTFTISCLFASLMQALVSIQVPQQYGNDVTEFVSMEKLEFIHNSIMKTYNQYKDVIPEIPKIKPIIGTPVKVNKFVFPNTITTYNHNGDLIVSSQAFYLQSDDNNNNFGIGIDLGQIHYGVVFSIILSNSTNDLVGKLKNTILIRNGITATAAKKVAGGQTRWFYHGKPMTDENLKLYITVANDQFTICTQNNEGQFIVQGDAPVSGLTEKQIGNVKNQVFYLNLFLKKKNGYPITIKTFPIENGYIHNCNFDELPQKPSIEQIENAMDNLTIEKKLPDKLEKLPLYVSLKLSGDTTAEISKLLMNEVTKITPNVKFDTFSVKRGVKDPGHITLIFNKDLPLNEYHDFVLNNHYNYLNQCVDIKLIGFALDKSCIAFLVELPDNIKYHPADKNLHITMMLNGKPPVYSNTLITRIKNKLSTNKKLGDDELIHYFQDKVTIPTVLEFCGFLKK
jgi:ubiquitin-protein ligase